MGYSTNDGNPPSVLRVPRGTKGRPDASMKFGEPIQGGAVDLSGMGPSRPSTNLGTGPGSDVIRHPSGRQGTHRDFSPGKPRDHGHHTGRPVDAGRGSGHGGT